MLPGGQRWRFWVGVVLAGFASLVILEARGQERFGRGRGRDRRPLGVMPTDAAAGLRWRLERAERLISMFDTNRDGIIEPNEVRGQSRYIYERMAKEAGLDPTQAIAVSEFRTAVFRYIQQTQQQAKPSSSPASSPSSGPPGETDRAGSARSGSSSSGSSVGAVMGFGAPRADLPKPAGFAPSRGSSGSSSTFSSRGGFSPQSAPQAHQELERRVRQYAQSLFRQYDANKNGVLEREEWQQMRGSPEKADRNHDGLISLEELTQRELERNRLALAGTSSSGGETGRLATSAGASSSTKSAASSSISSASSLQGSRFRWRSPSSSSSARSRSGQPGRVRFLTPLERLPKGMPDWFVQKDADADGQVSMAEFATEWTDAKAAEFQKYDLNNDGIITPEECLRAEKAQ